MSDQCGHPTTSGDPCQNPTTDDGDPDRCWIPSHNDPDAENPHGREFVIDSDDHHDILDAARMGMSKSGCARAAGVQLAHLNRYLEAHDDFRSAFTRARHKGERRLVKGPLYESEPEGPTDRPQMDGQHARFLLSTSFDYVKTEKRELEDVSDGDGFGTTIVLDSEYADE